MVVFKYEGLNAIYLQINLFELNIPNIKINLFVKKR